MFELEPRAITVLVLTFIVCLGGGLTVYAITQSKMCAWIAVAFSYAVVVLALSVLTKDKT